MDESYPRKLPKAFWCGIVLLSISLIWSLFDYISYVTFENRMQSLNASIQQMQQRVPQAEIAYNHNHLFYANKWSDPSWPQTLGKALADLNPNGTIPTLYVQAKQLEGKDQARASVLLDKIEQVLKPEEDVVNKILGPPGQSGQGLYDKLAFKANHAIHEVETAQSTLDQKGSLIHNMELSPWNLSHNVTFTDARAQLATAQSELKNAKITLATHIEREIIDGPTAYDSAVDAENDANSAYISATTHQSLAQTTWIHIQNVQTNIDNAHTQINRNGYNQKNALDRLGDATTKIAQALRYFYSQNYLSAKSAADDADSIASDAVSMSAPPSSNQSVTSSNTSNTSIGSSNKSSSSYGSSSNSGSSSSTHSGSYGSSSSSNSSSNGTHSGSYGGSSSNSSHSGSFGSGSGTHSGSFGGGSGTHSGSFGGGHH